MSNPRVMVVVLTGAERDLLVGALHLAEEFEADHEATRPLLELLQRAMTTSEARRAAAEMFA